MTLKELIQEASEKSPKFKQKLEWYTVQRKKTPELPWLMNQLEDVLGRDYVKEAANKAIEAADSEDSGQSDV